MAFLSIIVPVYNKEKYIEETVLSILNQSFKNFELILVDDGSIDGSLAKCQEFAKIDPRIKVICQKNSGVSAARNAGLEVSTGEYIGFIDADDTIEPDMYELLINNAIAHQADISVCRIRVFLPNKEISPLETKGAQILSHDAALSANLRGDLDRSANNKIYKSTLLHKLFFTGHIYEDILFTCKAFLKADKTVVENTVKYNYVVRDNSVSMSKFNLKYMETIAVSAEMVKMVNGENPTCLPEAQNFDIVANISLLNLLLLSNPKIYSNEFNTVKSNLKRYSSFINRSPLVRKKHKYAYKLFSLSPKLYSMSMQIYCRLAGSEAINRA